MPAPVLAPVAAAIYAELQPALGYEDDRHGYALAHRTAVVADPVDRVAALAYDPIAPFASLYDPDRCPFESLAFCAAAYGVTLTQGMTEAQARELIRERPARSRGTLASLDSALRAVLPEGALLEILRRTDPASPGQDAPYDMTILVRAADSPGEDVLRAVAETQRPRGVVHHFVESEGITWQELRDADVSWQELQDAGISWQDLRDGELP